MAWDGMKSTLSLLLGLTLLVLGSIPLLNQLGLWGLALPGFLRGAIPQIVEYLFAVGGLYLLLDSYEEWGEWYFWPTALIGLGALTAGIIMVLHDLAVLPFGVPLMTPLIYNIVFVLEGFFLSIGAFLQL